MNEKEYIEREAALSAQNKSMNLNEMRERLKCLPAADVVPVRHGKWINGVCTACKNDVWINGQGVWGFDYCPNCGARMDGGRS